MTWQGFHGTCPVCDQGQLDIKVAAGATYGYEVTCPCCGKFIIDGTVAAQYRPEYFDYRFPAWIRQHEEQGADPPRLGLRTWDRIDKTVPHPTIERKIIELLRAIRKRSHYFGEFVAFSCSDFWPVCWARNADELLNITASLLSTGALVHNGAFPTVVGVKLSHREWVRLESSSAAPLLNDQAFVAMSFDLSLDGAWTEGFRLGVDRAGYRALRVDKVPHNTHIDQKIIADIRDSYFVIADFTQQKPGVYFEAGYALALGRPVIWTVRDDDVKNLHFDTRQYAHIVWRTPDELADRLEAAICAIIGRGPVSKGNIA